MARFRGKVGYTVSVETSPDVWTEEIIEKSHGGEVLKHLQRWEDTGEINDSLNLSVTISIVANSFSINNMHNMRYVIFNGGKWKIKSIEVDHPRILLRLGGLYNG